ncbi:gamma-glutamylcyclotransferase [Alkalicoccus urumqiensis]|uniref:Gamma-glutamylcyclotransferase n=1 Tax=Alkalicoccus urumqiensis TaxID=1548213 RepID=A0A2P6MKV2_ALKUR|nr:gamma-glutamylcyclotransferase family protein [Alkalicoccus urumqiensis]PRO66912.1 gamma-glutamylcyclotransferase [Alkalicoccus urumqiensis]
MLLFVYGTLRKFQTNHSFLDEMSCVSENAWSSGKLCFTSQPYPALLEGSEDVIGELYEITGKVDKLVERLEGYDPDNESSSLYLKRLVPVHTDRGSVFAWTYFYQEDDAVDPVPFQDWSLHRMLDEGVEPLRYFAYGSCMDSKRIERDGCFHEFHKKTRGKVPGWQVEYRFALHDGSRADLVETQTGPAEGVLYSITESARKYLWEREGVTKGWYRPAVIPVLQGKNTVPALTFLVCRKEEESAPPSHYAEEILRGASEVVSAFYYKQLEARLQFLSQ